jgi:hypothetical protein
MDKIYPTGGNSVAALPRESGFKIWCFAEDSKGTGNLLSTGLSPEISRDWVP